MFKLSQQNKSIFVFIFKRQAFVFAQTEAWIEGKACRERSGAVRVCCA